MVNHTLLFRVACFLLLSATTWQATSQVVYDSSDTTRLPQVALPEVQITSLREPGRLSRLPVSAEVLGQEHLQRMQVSTLKNAAQGVANLFMPDYGSRLTSPVYIRGIGSRINAPSVGLYVDHVPYFEKSVFDFDLLNTGRIEVLRGPQGTLYGRNTMGGLINVQSLSPFSHQGTQLTLGGGNPMLLHGTASHYQMLSPRVGLSVSAGVNRHEGFFRNVFLDQMADAHFSAGGRVRLMWQINSALSAELTSHLEHLDQGGYPYAIYDTDQDSTLAVNYNHASSYGRLMNSNGLVFKYSTPGVHLQSVSALQVYDDQQAIDQDFSPADLVFATQQQQQLMLSQEFTARSGQQGSYQWLFGLFGFRQSLENDLDIVFGQDAVAMGMVPATLSRRQFSDNLTHGLAAFHQSTFHDFLVSNLSLTAGLRLDYEQAQLDFSQHMEADFATPPPSGFDSRLSFYEWLPRLALNYEFNRGSGVYATIVRGYKSGGFNVVFEQEEDRSFQPEYSWNYELGFRGRLLNDRLALQSSLFYIDWKSQQIYQMLPSGQGSMLKNAGASVSQGLELDVEALLSHALTLNASYGYTHATFKENKPRPDTDFSGNFIPYVPRYTLFGGITWRLPLRAGMLQGLRLHAGYRRVGEHYWDEANAMGQTSYGLVNMMVSLEAGAFVVDLFANNITSVEYHSFSFAALGRNYVQQGRPATFGMNLSYSF